MEWNNIKCEHKLLQSLANKDDAFYVPTYLWAFLCLNCSFELIQKPCVLAYREACEQAGVFS